MTLFMKDSKKLSLVAMETDLFIPCFFSFYALFSNIFPELLSGVGAINMKRLVTN